MLELPASAGWASPAETVAAEWADAVLQRADEVAVLSPSAGETMVWTSGIDDGIEMRVSWAGDRHMEVQIRRAADSHDSWVGYGWVQLPRDTATATFIIDFTAQRFEELVSQWVDGFDLTKAENKLANAANH